MPDLNIRTIHFKNHRSLFMRILTACFFFCFTINVSAQPKRFSFTQPKIGSQFTIIFYANDSLQADAIAKQCFNLVDSFTSIFSDYIDTSELSRLSASAGFNKQVAVSPAMLDILILSQTAFKKSEGAFDITIGPVVKLWRQARKTKQFPSPEMVKATRRLTGFKNIVIDSINKKVILRQKGMQLDLGGIAQGYIAQKVMDLLSHHHITIALVNASGDIVMTGAPPGTKGWTIGVNVPGSKEELLGQKLLIQNKTVSTSGDAYQYFEHGGKRYSHIVDPRTGYGVTSMRNVTVIADDGTTADWLATACSILPIKKAIRLVTQLGAEVLIAEIKNDKLIFHSSKNFSLYWKQPAP